MYLGSCAASIHCQISLLIPQYTSEAQTIKRLHSIRLSVSNNRFPYLSFDVYDIPTHQSRSTHTHAHVCAIRTSTRKRQRFPRVFVNFDSTFFGRFGFSKFRVKKSEANESIATALYIVRWYKSINHSIMAAARPAPAVPRKRRAKKKQIENSEIISILCHQFGNSLEAIKNFVRNRKLLSALSSVRTPYARTHKWIPWKLILYECDIKWQSRERASNKVERARARGWKTSKRFDSHLCWSWIQQ